MNGTSADTSEAEAAATAAAERWLVRLGRPVTPEAVEALVPHLAGAETRDMRAARAWASLLRSGKAPTKAAVAELVAAEIGRSTVRRQLNEDVSRRAADFIATYVDEHGTGPSWMALFAEMGWSRDAGTAVMPLLRRDGWLEFTRQAGSLRPGPRALDGAAAAHS